MTSREQFISRELRQIEKSKSKTHGCQLTFLNIQLSKSQIIFNSLIQSHTKPTPHKKIVQKLIKLYKLGNDILTLTTNTSSVYVYILI